MGKFQVDDVPRRERRWGAGVTDREVIRRQMAADGGAVGWRREIKLSRKAAETGGTGGARILMMLAIESKTIAIHD